MTFQGKVGNSGLMAKASTAETFCQLHLGPSEHFWAVQSTTLLVSDLGHLSCSEQCLPIEIVLSPYVGILPYTHVGVLLVPSL